MKLKIKKEIIIKNLFFFNAFLSIIFLSSIIFLIFKESIGIFQIVSIKDFLFGKYWYPIYEPPEYGILPLILATLFVTAGAIIIALPLGLGSAIFIAEIANKKFKELLKPIIELLAAIPSVIYGFIGITVIGPIIKNIFHLPVGLNGFTASLLLGFMAIPIITSISEDAISSVNNDIKEASLALGANKWETIVKIILPSVYSSIITAIILGIGRAIGETMTVLLVAGGSAVIPKSIFTPLRPMTATIASEMGEVAIGSNHYHALFGIAIVLFCITLIANLIIEFIRSRSSVEKN